MNLERYNVNLSCDFYMKKKPETLVISNVYLKMIKIIFRCLQMAILFGWQEPPQIIISMHDF